MDHVRAKYWKEDVLKKRQVQMVSLFCASQDWKRRESLVTAAHVRQGESLMVMVVVARILVPALLLLMDTTHVKKWASENGEL